MHCEPYLKLSDSSDDEDDLCSGSFVGMSVVNAAKDDSDMEEEEDQES